MITLRAFRLAAAILAAAIVASAAGSSAGAPARGAIESTGDALRIALPVGAACFAAIQRDGAGIVQFAEAGLLGFGATLALKYSIDETRPNGEPRSFPSGHSVSAFWAAEFLRKRYGWKFGIPVYAAAAFVGYSRVEAEAHYTHDVLAGAAIGIGASCLFTKPHRGWRLRVEPQGGGVRLIASVRW